MTDRGKKTFKEHVRENYHRCVDSVNAGSDHVLAFSMTCLILSRECMTITRLQDYKAGWAQTNQYYLFRYYKK